MHEAFDIYGILAPCKLAQASPPFIALWAAGKGVLYELR